MSKRKKRGKRRNKGLSGVAATAPQKQRVIHTLKEGGLMLLAALAGGGAGAAFGKHSLVAGIPVTLFGIYKNNKYITAAGLGVVLSNGFQRQGTTVGSTEGVNGFDLKQIAANAKDRVGTFFQNFSEKLYLPKSTAMGELGQQEEQVTYFVNPYSNRELDMSAMDRIQEQIAQMNRPVEGHFEDLQQGEMPPSDQPEFDREF